MTNEHITTCNTNSQYFTKTRLISHILLLIIRLLKSSFLNILIFILGFAGGYVYVSSTMHKHAYEKINNESISKIKHFIAIQRNFNNLIDDELLKLEDRLSYDNKISTPNNLNNSNIQNNK